MQYRGVIVHHQPPLHLWLDDGCKQRPHPLALQAFWGAGHREESSL